MSPVHKDRDLKTELKQSYKTVNVVFWFLETYV